MAFQGEEDTTPKRQRLIFVTSLASCFFKSLSSRFFVTSLACVFGVKTFGIHEGPTNAEDYEGHEAYDGYEVDEDHEGHEAPA